MFKFPYHTVPCHAVLYFTAPDFTLLGLVIPNRFPHLTIPYLTSTHFTWLYLTQPHHYASPYPLHYTSPNRYALLTGSNSITSNLPNFGRKSPMPMKVPPYSKILRSVKSSNKFGWRLRRVKWKLHSSHLGLQHKTLARFMTTGCSSITHAVACSLSKGISLSRIIRLALQKSV